MEGEEGRPSCWNQSGSPEDWQNMWDIAFPRWWDKLQNSKRLKQLIQPPHTLPQGFHKHRMVKEDNPRLLRNYSGISVGSWLLQEMLMFFFELNELSHRASYASRSLSQLPSICNSFCTWKGLSVRPHTELMPWLHSIMVISLASFACSKRCSNPFLTRWLFLQLTVMKSTSCFNLQKWSPDSSDPLERIVVWCCLLFNSLFDAGKNDCFFRRIKEEIVDIIFLQCKCHLSLNHAKATMSGVHIVQVASVCCKEWTTWCTGTLVGAFPRNCHSVTCDRGSLVTKMVGALPAPGKTW